MSTDLNRVSFNGLDFDSHSDELRARLQVKFAATFNDFSVSSMGIVLLDIIAYGLDTLSFYLDRRATDTYLQTARTRKSVALLTRQLGYKMGGAVASSTDLTVAAKVVNPFAVPIPKGFRFQGPGNAVFEVANAVTIPPSSTAPVSVPVYQGQTTTESFVSNGLANQRFPLSRVPDASAIVQGTVTCTVNGTPYVESEFLTFDATNQFEIGYNDDPPTIRFGDGTAGNIPIKNGSIVVTYVASLGAAGQCLQGTITKVVTPLVVLFQQIDLSVNNAQSTVGGSDLEDLDHAKIFAPKVFKSRKVAITKGDYEALAGSFADPLFGRVAVAQAIAARSASSDLELQNHLTDISNNLTSATIVIDAALNDPVSGAFVEAGAIAGNNAAIQGAVTDLLSKLNSVNTNLSSILTSARTIKGNAGESGADYSEAHSEVVNAKTDITSFRATIAGLTIAGGSQLTSGDSTAFLAILDGLTDTVNRVDALLGLINGLTSSVSASADSQVNTLQTVQSSMVNDIGLDTVTDALMKTLNDNAVSSVVAVGSASIPFTGLYSQLHAILDTEELNATTIAADLGAIASHVDALLAADCEANLVVVPILSRDASGFYAAPSNGLIRAVQGYLDTIKEVTHTVSVTSGANFLLPAAIRIRLGIRLGISEATTTASAETIVDGVLRDRAFGESLYISDLVNPLKSLPGVSFVNATILGYRPSGGVITTDKLDSDGNLIVSDNFVLSLSQDDLTIATEIVTS